MSGEQLQLVAVDSPGDVTGAALDRLGVRVGLSGALQALDREARATTVAEGAPGATGFTWDRADASDRNWWPQGLTTSAEAAAIAGRPWSCDRQVVLSAWYAKQAEESGAATRISVVDLDTGRGRPRYAHALLVAPYRDKPSDALRHRPVRVHAGGLAWCGNRLLVADTRRGVRVFDLDDLVRLRSGAAQPRGFGFALPQCGLWRAGAQGDSRPLRWSYLSLDRTEQGALSLVAGEYVRGGEGSRLARFALDPGTGLLLPTPAVEVVRTDLGSMQGAVCVDGTYVVSASSGALRRGHLWTGKAGGPWTKHARELPVGPEDLSYDPATGRLWTQTEYPYRRSVVSLPLAPLVSPGARR